MFDDHHKTYRLTSFPSWSFLRCIRSIYICKENGPLGHFYKYGASQTCTSLQCAEQCPVPRLVRPTNMPLSGKTQCPAAIFHHTVRCALDCPLSLRPTIDFTTGGQRLTATESETVRSQKQSATIRSHRTLRCAIGAGRSNGRLTWWRCKYNSNHLHSENPSI
jgi:hypothetical protein